MESIATEKTSVANSTETLFEKISASTLRLQTLCVDSDPESYSEITILIDEILKLAASQIDNKQTGSVAISQANLARTQMIQLAKTIAQKAEKTHKYEICILYRQLQPVFGWSNASGKQFISIFNKARIAAKYKFYEQNLLRVAKIAGACLACEKTFALILNFGNTLHSKEKQNASEDKVLFQALRDKVSELTEEVRDLRLTVNKAPEPAQ